ncbi:MAG TPA: hypothetical protein VEO00_07760 [Actinomycetota bacterium]|nr:hypothetical protein [Actinomycetota bacterium]
MTATNGSGSAPAGFDGTVVLTQGVSGLVFVPSPTPLTHLNFYDGKFLRAADLTLEQLGQRMLVELSNRAGGPGIAFGFDVSIGSNDVLSLSAGLAIDPQGRVLLLPAAVSMSVATLIQESRGLAIPAITEGTGGSATFALCDPAIPPPTVQSQAGTELYLLTIGHMEGLCGNEEVFGRLCDDNCVTADDRPYLLEGVVMRALPLRLSHALVTSTAVALGRVHLRSQVASAYFADEWDRGGTLLSSAGLAAATWCQGAAAMVGDAVPVGVLARAGTSTMFLDEWTARRERIEPPPRRYWDGRMELRPWDVFLAQVLQFQCQLSEILSGGARGLPGGGTDPCDDAHTLLDESVRLIKELGKRATAGKQIDPELFEKLPGLATFGSRSEAVLDRLPVSSGRILIDGGIVELPPAGYLPVDPHSTVALSDQVRRLLGEGLDLRFCAVRRDQIAHELERAQHMNRISLLAGLDDPANKQNVDILVPDGTVSTVPAKTTGIGLDVDAAIGSTTRSMVFNRSLSDSSRLVTDAATDPSALPIRGAARLTPTAAGGLQFVSAGSFVTGDRTAMIGVMRTMARSATGAESFRNAVDRLTNLGDEVPESQPMEVLANEIHRSAAVARAGDEEIRAVSLEQPAEGPQTAVMWVTFTTDRDPFTVSTGTVGVQASIDTYAPGRPALSVRQELIGRLEILHSSETPTGGREVGVKFTASLDARHLGLRGIDEAPPSVSFLLTLTSETSAGLRRIKVSTTGEKKVLFAFTAGWQGSPIEANARLVAEVQGEVAAGFGALALLHEDATITQQGNEYHDIALQALIVLQGWILDDPGFLARAVQLLFPTQQGTGTSRVGATTDWVLFRRRRREDCGEVAVVPQPVGPSVVATWFTKAESLGEAGAIGSRLGSGELGDEVEWTRIGSAEFDSGTATRLTSATELQQQWLNAGAGRAIGYAGYASTGGEPVAFAQPRAQALVAGVAQVAPLDVGGKVEVVVNPPRAQMVAGTEGSVFFVTLEPPQHRVSCVEVFIVDDVNSSPEGKMRLKALEQGDVVQLDDQAVQSKGRVTFTDDQPDLGQLQQVEDAVAEAQAEFAHGLFQQRFPRVLAWVASSFDSDPDGPGAKMAIVVADRLGVPFFGPKVLNVDFDPGASCPVRLYVLEFLG